MTPRRLVKQTSKIAFVEEGVFEVELGLSQVKLIDFISPLKALWVNFRFNQAIGIFPARILDNYMVLKFDPRLFLWTAIVKVATWSAIFGLLYLWLRDQGMSIGEVYEKIMGVQQFTGTDYFAIIAHYMFLQVTAYFLFFNNLTLCSELTKLNAILKNLAEECKDGNSNLIPNPPVMMLYAYRVSLCVLCFVTSIIYFCGLRGLIPDLKEANSIDAALIFAIVLVLYFENQNHNFTEMLFLRLMHVLKHHSEHLLAHLQGPFHCTKKMGTDHECCYRRAEILQEMYTAINDTFGNDIFITIAICVISIVFGFYLLMTFAVFIPGDKMGLLILSYLLYSAIPSIRLFVLVEGSEVIRRRVGAIRTELINLETKMICSSSGSVLNCCHSADLAQLRRVLRMFDDNPGFTASGYFSLNRSIVTSLVGSLFTYLIVLLQLKAADVATLPDDGVPLNRNLSEI